MKKKDLIVFLEPFDDDIEVEIKPVHRVDEFGYAEIARSNFYDIDESRAKEKRNREIENKRRGLSKERFFEEFSNHLPKESLEEIWDSAGLLASCLRYESLYSQYQIACERMGR